MPDNNNLYNDLEFADSIIGKNVHMTTKCMKIDASGIIDRYELYKNEIIYILNTEKGSKLHIGANSPGLDIDMVNILR